MVRELAPVLPAEEFFFTHNLCGSFSKADLHRLRRRRGMVVLRGEVWVRANPLGRD
jgi:hypothetical protein